MARALSQPRPEASPFGRASSLFFRRTHEKAGAFLRPVLAPPSFSGSPENGSAAAHFQRGAGCLAPSGCTDTPTATGASCFWGSPVETTARPSAGVDNFLSLTRQKYRQKTAIVVTCYRIFFGSFSKSLGEMFGWCTMEQSSEFTFALRQSVITGWLANPD